MKPMGFFQFEKVLATGQNRCWISLEVRGAPFSYVVNDIIIRRLDGKYRVQYPRRGGMMAADIYTLSKDDEREAVDAQFLRCLYRYLQGRPVEFALMAMEIAAYFPQRYGCGVEDGGDHAALVCLSLADR